MTHVVSTDALATLGTIIDASAGRDAIHLAVEPVIAVEKLYPGQHVGFVDGGVGSRGKPIGIVDPFIAGFVAPGQHFWLVVYPRTITSLRHVWEHPAFVAVSSTAEVTKPELPKEASVAWMTAWAVKHVSENHYVNTPGKSPQEAFNYAVEAGHDHNIGSYEEARNYIDDTWWDHWEAITGARGDRGSWFSCSC